MKFEICLEFSALLGVRSLKRSRCKPNNRFGKQRSGWLPMTINLQFLLEVYLLMQVSIAYGISV